MPSIADQIELLKRRAVEHKQAGRLQDAVICLRQFKALEAQAQPQPEAGAAAAAAAAQAQAVQTAQANQAAQAKQAASRMLFEAAKEGHEAAFKTAIAMGADVNALQENDYTALHAACRNGYHLIVGMLMPAGANPALETSFGRTAEDLAVREGHKECVRMLNPHHPCLESSGGGKPDPAMGGDAVAALIAKAMQEAEVEVEAEDAAEEEGGGGGGDSLEKMQKDMASIFANAKIDVEDD